MPQSDGKNRLKRMEIEFDGQTYKFNINPEEYTQDEPSRSTVTQTKGGAFIDDFGAGLPTIFIKGSTGFQRGLGVEKFKELRDKVRKYYETGTLGSAPSKEMIFHNFTDDESWVVHTDPSGIRLLRNKNNPLLYMYELRFICLRPANEPAKRKKTGGVNQSIGTNTALVSKKTSSDLETAIQNLTTRLNIVAGTMPTSLANFIQELEVLGTSIKNINTSIKNIGARGMFTLSTETPAVKQVKTTYENELSKLALDEIKKLKSGVREYKHSNLKVPLLDEIEKQKLPLDLKEKLRGLFLELFSISKNYQNENFKNKIVNIDVHRIINNINHLCEELFQHSRKTYKIIEELRLIQRALYYLLGSELLEESVQDKIESLRAN